MRHYPSWQATRRPAAQPKTASTIRLAPRPQQLKDLIDADFGPGVHGMKMDFRRRRRFVVAVDAGEIFELAAPSLRVEALHVAPLAFLQRSVDVNFDKFARIEQAPRQLAFR